MTHYLLGMATLPTVAAVVYGSHRLWWWLKDNRAIAAVVARIVGVRMPQKLHDRAVFGVRVATCQRVWGVDLPGRVSILVTAGRTRLNPDVWLRAASALTWALSEANPPVDDAPKTAGRQQ